MRWRIIAILICSLKSLPVHAQPTASEIARYPHGEAEMVYRAVFDDVFRSDEPPRTILVYDSLGHGLARIDSLIPGAPGYPPGFGRDALQSFLRVTGTGPHPHEGRLEWALAPFPRFTHSISLTRIPGEVLAALRASRQTDTILVLRNGSDPMLIEEEPFWTAFRKQYPDAWGYTVLTRVGFNLQITDAFVQIMHRCYSDCTSVESVFLRKGSTGWAVLSRVLHREASSEGFPPGQLRYVGKGGWMRAANARYERERQRQVADSLRRHNAPRRIRGRVVNAQTGRGLAGHPVYQLLVPDNNPDRVAVTDEQGLFTISDPAIGGWHLSVQCSEWDGVDRSVADASFYVGQGTDTTVVFEARSLAPCWKRTIHPLQSGDEQSAAYSTSSFPGESDARIYEKILAAMFQAGAKRPLLLAETVGRCSDGYAHCDGYESLSILLREAVIDSATYRAFTAPLNPSTRFNPSFAKRNNLVLLTPAILAYFAEEAVAARAEPGQYYDPGARWYGTVRAYPNASGILSFTRPAFNVDSTQSLVTVRWQRSVEKEETRSFLLERDDGEWRIERSDLEAEPLTAEFQGGRCLIARGGIPFQRSAAPSLRGRYRFTYVATNGEVEQADLDMSRFMLWHPDEPWDGSAGHKLLKIRAWGGNLFGTWQEIGGDAYRVDPHGNRLPEMSGHFCATPM